VSRPRKYAEQAQRKRTPPDRIICWLDDAPDDDSEQCDWQDVEQPNDDEEGVTE
jgi:hypothetical protein